MAKKERAHAVLSASGAERWLSCSGSVRLCEGMPNISSQYAIEGTAAHDMAAQLLKSKHDAKGWIGAIVKVPVPNGKPVEVEVTEEMADAVQIYLDFVREEYMKAGPGTTLTVEKKFRLDWLHPNLFGTNDAMIGQPFGKLTVVDFKYGAGVAVEVEKNPQLLYYGCGAAHGDAYEEVELVVVQPRAIHPAGPIRKYSLTIDELHDWAYNVLLPGVRAAEDPNAPLKMGKYCQFCNALAVCPLPKEKAMVVAASVFAEAPTAPPDPELMDYAQLRKALDVSSIVEAWFKACHSHARTLLEQKKVTPEVLGYKLVEGRATRKWADEGATKAWLTGLLGEDAYVVKLASPAQAEKLLKKEGKAALENMVAVTRGVQMVPVSDKRPAIEGAGEVFEAIEL